MCNLVGSWHFYNWSVLKCEGGEKFSKVSVKIRRWQGKKKVFPRLSLLCPLDLAIATHDPGSWYEDVFVNVRTGVLYEGN